MRLLHISDLHRAGRTETLRAIWNGPHSALRKLPEAEQRFDLIVVSGDLAGAAQSAEYSELHEFACSSLLPLLREPDDRARIIFVPGNHDVDWHTQIGEPLRLAEMLASTGGSERLAALLQRYRDDPARSQVRHAISKYGHIEWMLLDEARHNQRFANVQKFLREFYAGCLREPHREFDLLAGYEGADWSAHLFLADRIAVYGFNSCFLNDRYWTGAAISRESIANAAAHANEHAEGCLRLAVWHHGIHTEGYRPDYLNQADLGALIVAGFQVGLHGHVHKAEAQQLGWLTDRFALIGTGSLGANQEQRPDAVGKQFSVVQLHPHQVSVQVYERSGDIAVYTRRPLRTIHLGHTHEREVHEVGAGEHQRHAHLDRNGISTVRVRISELRSLHPLVLAEVTPPVGGTRCKPPQGVSGFEVREVVGQDGTVRFMLYPHDHRTADLDWTYEASNVIPLTQAEVPRYHGASRRRPDVAQRARVLRGHVVRFACRRLCLRFTFDDPVVEPGSVRKLVLRCVTHNGEEHWERVPNEEQRCALVEHSATELALTVEGPMVGYHYAIDYSPRPVGHHLEFTGGRIAARLLDRCLKDRELGLMLSYQLAETIAVAVAAVFSHSPSRLAWMGLLWSDTEGCLRPAFGNFANREWSCSYPCGSGVPGHAFRFNRPAAWCRGAEHSRDALVYQGGRRDPFQAVPEPSGQSDHDWIVCIPLVGDATKNPLGVVLFEGQDKDQGLGDRLREFAKAALAQAVTKGSPWEVFQQTLSSAVNAGFWQACVHADCLEDYRQHIRGLIAELGLGSQADISLTDGSVIDP